MNPMLDYWPLIPRSHEWPRPINTGTRYIVITHKEVYQDGIYSQPFSAKYSVPSDCLVIGREKIRVIP